MKILLLTDAHHAVTSLSLYIIPFTNRRTDGIAENS